MVRVGRMQPGGQRAGEPGNVPSTARRAGPKRTDHTGPCAVVVEEEIRKMSSYRDQTTWKRDLREMREAEARELRAREASERAERERPIREAEEALKATA